jgi:hypothetical protein
MIKISYKITCVIPIESRRFAFKLTALLVNLFSLQLFCKSPIGTTEVPAVDFNPLQEVNGCYSIEKCSNNMVLLSSETVLDS